MVREEQSLGCELSRSGGDMTRVSGERNAHRRGRGGVRDRVRFVQRGR